MPMARREVMLHVDEMTSVHWFDVNVWEDLDKHGQVINLSKAPFIAHTNT